MRIALISVAPPFRGGISKHTSILVEKLSSKYYVDVINYKRQYPNFIFPGKSQFLEDELVENIGNRHIDSINPISWINTAKIIINCKYDLVIFRCWNPFLCISTGIIAKILRKKEPSLKLISLIDNIKSHEKVLFGSYLMNFLLNKMHGHLVQSTKTESELSEIIIDPIYEKRFHPIFNNFSKNILKNDALIKLNMKSQFIILFFGIIREYKGLDILIKSASYLKSKTFDFHVLIAGECYSKKEKYIDLIKKYNLSKNITWHEEYISDNDVSTYFSVADICVLPYRSASQSGIVKIAFHYNLPVIVTKVGNLQDVVVEGKSGFIIEPENPKELSKILYKLIVKNKLNEMIEFIKLNKSIFSWKNFIHGIESLYKRI